MKHTLNLLVLFVVGAGWMVGSAGGAPVLPGESILFRPDQLSYSDDFAVANNTLTSWNGAPTVTWSNGHNVGFSYSTGEALSGAGPIPGVPNLHGDTFIVQFDARPAGTAYITDFVAIRLAPDSSMTGTGTLDVAFYRDGTIRIGPPTGFTTSLSTDASQHNFAAYFQRDATRNTVSFYFDQTLVGTTDLNTFNGGAYANYANAYAGWHRNNTTRFDNFQIAIPEPASAALLALAGVVLLNRRQRRRGPEA